MGRVVTTTLAPSRSRLDPWLVASLAAVYIVWSSTYLAMRIAVADLPPLLMASMRFASAGLVMLLYAKRRGAAWPSTADWLRAVPVGALLFLGGNGQVAMAERTVSSGGAAVVCATMPLWVGVFGVITGDRPTMREWLSLVLGFIGVLVLMGGPSLSGDPLDIAMVIASPICWALGSVIARRGPKGDPIMTPALQMIVGGVVLVIAGGLRGERIPADAGTQSWLALGYLWVFGSLIGFTAYSWLLRNARPTVATSYAYINPILAVVIGAVFSGEALGGTTVIANILIVGAVMLALMRPKRVG